MPEVTIQNLLDAQRTIAETVDDIGVVLTRERHVDDRQWIALFDPLNSGEHKGLMILFQQIVSQTKGPRIGTVQARVQFSYEMIYPFNDKRDDNLTSHEVFVQRIEALNDALNLVVDQELPWALGITTPGADVEHQFLQGDGPISVRRWGVGEAAVKTHYWSATLEVLYVRCVHEHSS